MRNRRVLQYLHTASRRIIKLLVAEGIGTLIIGKNPLWKQGVELGREHRGGVRADPSRLHHPSS